MRFIPVTKPFIPSLIEYEEQLRGIWQREWLTNNGPVVKELEAELLNYLKLKNLLYVGNGTIAIQIAIKALELSGEIITTPFSYVATTSSIVWEGIVPVFADIHPETFNIDPHSIERVITKNTSAILATHCFGNPCDVEAIKQIADRYNLKVIYDAAHGFGTLLNGKSIFAFGDISTASFHATKLYHTVEGGAVIAKDDALCERIRKMRNFGHDGPERFDGVGINGKNSEFHAAMGLVVLNHIDDILHVRKAQFALYMEQLKDVEGIQFQKIHENCRYNHAYFPVVFNNEKTLLVVKEKLEQEGIHPRRYFFPVLSNLNYVKNTAMPVAEKIASSILCLPLFHELRDSEVEEICNIIKKALV